jgi:hypothetical protein
VAASRFLFELASAATYVYPNYDYGQTWITFILFGVALLGAVVIAFIRLMQIRVLKALLIPALIALSFLIPERPDRHRWKFNTYKASYAEAIQTDPSSPPKYQIFSWGNRNISFGGGVEFEAIVYDEADNINLPQNRRSGDWKGNPGLAIPEDRWVAADPLDCRRNVESLDKHFYYVRMEC